MAGTEQGHGRILGVCVYRKFFARRADPLSCVKDRPREGARLAVASRFRGRGGGGDRLSVVSGARMERLPAQSVGWNFTLRRRRFRKEVENVRGDGVRVLCRYVCAWRTSDSGVFLFRRRIPTGQRVFGGARARRARVRACGDFCRRFAAIHKIFLPLRKTQVQFI